MKTNLVLNSETPKTVVFSQNPWIFMKNCRFLSESLVFIKILSFGHFSLSFQEDNINKFYVKQCPCPPGLQVLYTYTMLTAGSKHISIMVWNMTDSGIFLKKGVHVAHVVSATLVPPVEVPSEEEPVKGTEETWEWLSVQERQKKMMDKLNLDGLSEWSLCNAATVRELLFSYHDIFALKHNELGCTSAIKHEIHINDNKPFKEHFRHIPPPLLEEVHASLRDMLDTGAIWPSQSPWCNTVVVVWNKDGSLQFCIDIRCLNTQTKKDSYPLPRIQEVLENMTGDAHFSMMDFKSGFWQVCMAPELQQYTMFMVGNLGFYKFTRMPFGLCNAPTTFQHLMQNTLGEINLTYCIIYLDDVIVFRWTEEEHLKLLWVVFECFREFNLKLKPAKSSFFQTETVYLVHHFSSEGICPSKENVCAIKEFPMPETYTQVRAFCGPAGHYHHVIKGFALLVHPLYNILGNKVKMGPVILPMEAQDAVWLLKEKIQSMPVLVFCNFDKPFLLETDASKEGLGVVLSQKQDDGCYHPVAFGSRTLMPSKQNYHSSNLEFLALKWSVTEHFKEYLAYAPFTVCMDTNPLTYVLTTPNLDAMAHHWVGALTSYEFTLEYQRIRQCCCWSTEQSTCQTW